MHNVVLCIDKRERNLLSDRLLLESAGYEVLTATDLDVALDFVRNNRDISAFLVSDSLSMDEEDVCAALHRASPSTRILLQRASFDKPDLPASADMVIPKTTPPREKLRLLRSLVASRIAA